jgi:hypothetical protein
MPTPNGEPFLGKNPELIQISNSEISMWKECRRKWWLIAYRGLLPKQRSLVGPLPLGTRVHNAMEAFYANGEDLLASYSKLVKADRILFENSPESNDPDKVKKFDSEAELGRIMLEGYKDWIEDEGLDADLQVIASERAISYRPEEFDGRVELMGKLDLLVRNQITEFYSALDLKTAATFDSYYKMYLLNEQLRMYALLMAKSNGDVHIDGGVYRILKKVKRSATARPPFYQQMNIPVSKKVLDSFEERTMGTLHDMVDARDRLDAGETHLRVAYPSPQDSCSWKCPFFNGCAMFDDGSAVEEWLADNFEQGDQYERYR